MPLAHWSDYSITSSARASCVGGSSRPIAFAVLSGAPEVAAKRLITASATKLPPRGAGSSARVSALWGIGERVIRIAGIHKIGTGFAQQSFDLLDRSPNYAARLAGLNLALQLEQAPIGAVETLRQNLAT